LQISIVKETRISIRKEILPQQATVALAELAELAV
jgi:hypothetical protein